MKEIMEIEEEVRKILEYVNDISHRVVELERDVEWIKTVLKWGISVICILLGLNIGL